MLIHQVSLQSNSSCQHPYPADIIERTESSLTKSKIVIEYYILSNKNAIGYRKRILTLYDIESMLWEI